MGLTVPVVPMGYYNPFLQYSLEKLCVDTKAAGADGFIVVDLPPEEGRKLSMNCVKTGLSSIPLVAPTSSDKRIAALSKMASSFMYCVSVVGVTGARDALPPDLEEFVRRIRAQSDFPIAIGFGISNSDMVQGVAADRVVVGSRILHAMDTLGKGASTKQKADSIRQTVIDLKKGVEHLVRSPKLGKSVKMRAYSASLVDNSSQKHCLAL
jgi:tryptophan synthase alpha subunit